MVECSKVNVKLSDTKLKKLKTAVKEKTGTTLRVSLKMVNGNGLPHELLLTTKQKTKLRNSFNNNMSTDLKFSRAHLWWAADAGMNKTNIAIWNNKFNNFKLRNEWHNENCSSSWRF